MVKLFVGNLAEGVDSHRLKNLFLQYVHVQECDVLKNFAFVHVVTEEDAETAISKLDKYRLEGREIHIERSTSRLRKEPGMGDKCFTCGAFDHKTPFCPLEAGKRKETASASSSNVSTLLKRSDESDANGGSPAKKARFLSSYLDDSKGNLTPNTACKIGGEETDPELPCPQNPELRTLYDQYIESRTRYFFYRDRLSREINALIESGSFVADTTTQKSPIHLGTIDLTKLSSSAAASVPASSAPTAIVQPVTHHVVGYASSAASSVPAATVMTMPPASAVQTITAPTVPTVHIGASSMAPAVQSYPVTYASTASVQPVQQPSQLSYGQQPQPTQPQPMVQPSQVPMFAAQPQMQQQPMQIPMQQSIPTQQPPPQPSTMVYGQQQQTVMQTPVQHVQPIMHVQQPQQQQQPPMVHQPPPVVTYSVAPNSGGVNVAMSQPQHSYSTYSSSTTLVASTPQITRVNLSAALNNQNAPNSTSSSLQNQEPQFRIKISAPPNVSASSSNVSNVQHQPRHGGHDRNRSPKTHSRHNQQQRDGSSNGNRGAAGRGSQTPDSANRSGGGGQQRLNPNPLASLADSPLTNPILANLAAATMAALRAAPRLNSNNNMNTRPVPLAQARPLLPNPRGNGSAPGGGASQSAGNSGSGFPPLMGRPRP